MEQIIITCANCGLTYDGEEFTECPECGIPE